MRRRGLKRVAIVLLAASCGSESRGPAVGTPDGGTVDALLDDAGDAAVGDGLVGDVTPTAAMTCDGAVDAMTAGDGAASASNAKTYFLSFARLQNGLCAGVSLPVDGAGQAFCQIFIVLATGDSCAAHSGLSTVAPGPDVVASILGTGEVLPSQAICVLAQLPTSNSPCGSCAMSSRAGWCYLTGAAAGRCGQAIAVSASGATPSGAVALLGCGTRAPSSRVAGSTDSVGVACVPSPELSAGFPGFDREEVTLDENNAACNGGVCLVNHFQGLTDCPYGQDSNGDPNPGNRSACTVPGTSTPVRPNDSVFGQTVKPQCFDRQAKETVYCSCRCANAEGNTNDEGSYCACPSGYTCTQVVPAIQSGDPRAGAYCVQSGATYNPNDVCAMQCNNLTPDTCP